MSLVYEHDETIYSLISLIADSTKLFRGLLAYIFKRMPCAFSVKGAVSSSDSSPPSLQHKIKPQAALALFSEFKTKDCEK